MSLMRWFGCVVRMPLGCLLDEALWYFHLVGSALRNPGHAIRGYVTQQALAMPRDTPGIAGGSG